jgi:DNA-binding YbaB/EbfC family protein
MTDPTSGGLPGGLGDLLKQAQGLQQQMARLQEELGDKRVEGSAGGGMVKVVVNGRQEVLSVVIEPAAVDPSDLVMLQDLVAAAVNVALARSKEMVATEMRRLTGGLPIPGM